MAFSHPSDNHLQNITGENDFTKVSKTMKFHEKNFKTCFLKLRNSKKNINSLDM